MNTYTCLVTSTKTARTLGTLNVVADNHMNAVRIARNLWADMRGREQDVMVEAAVTPANTFNAALLGGVFCD